MELLYEGKAKKIFVSKELPEGSCIMHFKDDATAFNNEKHETFKGKGELNCWITEYMLQMLEEMYIPTHYIGNNSKNSLMVKILKIIPVEVIIRNIGTGSFCKRYGNQWDGHEFDEPIMEFCIKDDDLGDPPINSDALVTLGIVNREDLYVIEKITNQINTILNAVFYTIGLKLVDFKLEFGKDVNGSIYLADEICPDTLRLWDRDTDESFDKDLYRYEKGDLLAGYKEVKRRLSLNVVEGARLAIGIDKLDTEWSDDHKFDEPITEWSNNND